MIAENSKIAIESKKKMENHMEKMEKLANEVKSFMERIVAIEEEKLKLLKDIKDQGKKD